MAEVLFRVIDLETSGMEPPAEIIETGWTDVLFETDSKACIIQPPQSALWRPSAGIPPETMAVHHIAPAMVADRPLLGYGDIDALMLNEGPQFIVAHQADFEQKWLKAFTGEGCYWIDTFKVALRACPDAPGHSNQTLRYWLDLDLDPAFAMPPHRAGPDSYVTAHILARLLAEFSVRQMVGWTLAPRYYATCPLQKHKGKPWAQVDGSYLRWMIGAPDMEADLKAAAQAELDLRRTR